MYIQICTYMYVNLYKEILIYICRFVCIYLLYTLVLVSIDCSSGKAGFGSSGAGHFLELAGTPPPALSTPDCSERQRAPKPATIYCHIRACDI